jgi:hypothetical protein
MSDKNNENNEKREAVVIRHPHYVSPHGGDWEIHLRPNPFHVQERTNQEGSTSACR